MEGSGGYPRGFCSTVSIPGDDDDNLYVTGAPSPGGYSSGERSVTEKRPRSHFDSDRKKRRAIANSNERKRMQSINAGFQSLRNLVCPQSGEKLSKAAILQYTADFIKTLLQEKDRLRAVNSCLEELVSGITETEMWQRCNALDSNCSPPQPRKRKLRETGSSTSSDEGIGFTSTDEVRSGRSSNTIFELRKQLKDLQCQVEEERSLRLAAEMDKSRLEKLHQVAPLPSQNTICAITSSLPSEAFEQMPPDNPCDVQNTMWQQNLETIVKAIRYIEGDHGSFGSTCQNLPEPEREEASNNISQSESAACPQQNSLLTWRNDQQNHLTAATASHSAPSLICFSLTERSKDVAVCQQFQTQRPCLTVPIS